MPILEIDGKQYAQSMAMARYLGRKYGLVGDTLEDDLEIDQNVDLFNDLRASKFYFPCLKKKYFIIVWVSLWFKPAGR